jgi:hypothetical protein
MREISSGVRFSFGPRRHAAPFQCFTRGRIVTEAPQTNSLTGGITILRRTADTVVCALCDGVDLVEH